MIRDIIITVRVLTPLHIGTGRKLTKDFDFVTRNNRTYRIREEGLIDELYARDPKLTEQLMRTPPGGLLKPDDLTDGSPYVRYVLPGAPGAREFREQIKDVHDRPYLPGSSLKGALRTVLTWYGWKGKGLTLQAVRLGNNAKYAAQDIEKKIFGPDPHHDLLRALRIADSDPASTDSLVIENVNVWAKRGLAAPISIEAIKEGTEFRIHATIDEALFTDWAAKTHERGYPFQQRDWFSDIPKIARARAAERIERELSWWQGRAEPSKLREIRSVLQSESDSSFPLQLGFGTGWEGTTIGVPLKIDTGWPEVYNLRDKRGRRWFKYKLHNPLDFPVSRRVIVRDRGHVTPLGWVWVTWKEV